MSDGPVVATGAVALVANAAPMSAAISAALMGMHGPLGQVKMAGESSAAGLGGAFTKAGGMIAAGLAIAGVAAIAFAVHAADTFKQVGTEVLKVQRYTGLSAEAASKLRFAAQESGVGADKLAKSLGFLSKNLESGKVNFDSYGIATVDANGKLLPLDKILFNVADKFKSMPNGVEKTAEAIKIFGKAGADMIPMLNRGGDGLRALEAEAQKYGLVLSGSNLKAIKDNIMAHREQHAAMQGLQVQIGQNVLPVLTKLTTAFTEGLLKVMPTVTGIMNGAVIPAFSVLASVLGGTATFVAEHQGAIKALAVVIGAALVPAVVAWGVAQGIVMAQNAIVFILTMASSAVKAASSIGLMTGSLEAGTVALTNTGIAAGGVMLAIGLLVMQYMHMQDSAKAAAAAVTKGAKDPQDAIAQLTVKQAEYHKEMGGGLNVLGLHIFALDSSAKKAALAAAGYKATTAEIAKLKDQQKQSADGATQAGAAIEESFTKSGRAIAMLGGATKLTSDQVEQLASVMKIDLTKATSDQIAKMVDQAQRLSITSEATLKLKDAQEILTSWTEDATKKTTAYKSAIDALIGTQTAAIDATIAYHQAVADLQTKMVAAKWSTDLNTQAGRDMQKQAEATVNAIIKMSEEDQKNGDTLDVVRHKMQGYVDNLVAVMHQAGASTAQINQFLAANHLTSAELDNLNPKVDAQANALGGVAGEANAAAASVWGLNSALGAAATAMFNMSGQAVTGAQVLQNYNQAVAASNTAAAAAAGASGALGNVMGPVLGRPAGGSGGALRHFAAGGVVPGAEGAPQLAVVHGGEEVLTPTQRKGGGTVTYVTHEYHIVVQGSVIRETELFDRARVHANGFNARAGGGR